MKTILRENALLMKILFSLGIVLVLALRIDYASLHKMAVNIHFLVWIWAFLFILLQIVMLSLRWMLIVNAKDRKMDLMTSLRITLVSFLANYLFITSAGGVIARVALAANHGIPVLRAAIATLADRMMTLAALCILALFSLFHLEDFVSTRLFSTSRALVIFLLTAAALAVAAIGYFNRRKLIFSNRKIALAFKYLRDLFLNPRLIGQITVISLVAQIFYFAAVYVILRSLGADAPVMQFMAVIPLITLISSLPIGYGGWGVRESAFIFGLGLIHLPVEVSFMASIQIGIISMITSLVTGIPAFFDIKTQNALKSWRLRHRQKS